MELIFCRKKANKQISQFPNCCWLITWNVTRDPIKTHYVITLLCENPCFPCCVDITQKLSQPVLHLQSHTQRIVLNELSFVSLLFPKEREISPYCSIRQIVIPQRWIVSIMLLLWSDQGQHPEVWHLPVKCCLHKSLVLIQMLFPEVCHCFHLTK